MDIETKDDTWAVFTRHESRAGSSLLWAQKRAQRAEGPLGFPCYSDPERHADSFKLDHFDQNFQLIFWLKVNKDTVSEASILEYDRYEPPLGARSCHRHLELWQDLKLSTYYVNHVLLVILRLMGTFKNVFKILIVQIPYWGWTLHLTKDMNDHMVASHFQVKGDSWHFAKKRNTSRYVFKRWHITSKLPLTDKFTIIPQLWDVTFTLA